MTLWTTAYLRSQIINNDAWMSPRLRSLCGHKWTKSDLCSCRCEQHKTHGIFWLWICTSLCTVPCQTRLYRSGETGLRSSLNGVSCCETREEGLTDGDERSPQKRNLCLRHHSCWVQSGSSGPWAVYTGIWYRAQFAKYCEQQTNTHTHTKKSNKSERSTQDCNMKVSWRCLNPVWDAKLINQREIEMSMSFFLLVTRGHMKTLLSILIYKLKLYYILY